MSIVMPRIPLFAVAGMLFWNAAHAQADCEAAWQEAKSLPNSASVARLEQSRRSCIRDTTYLSRLGRKYFESGDVEKARAITTAGLQIDPRHEGLLFGLGDIYLRQSRLGDAKAVATRLIEFHPNSYGGPYLMQRVLMDSRQFSEAIKYGDLAISKSNGQIVVLYLNNAVAAYHAAQDALCVRYAQEAIDRDPAVLRQAWGMNEAIYALDRSKRFPEALALAKRRKAADPRWSEDEAFVKILRVMGVAQ
jgi:tetratricopeptide (TPR) repeat protein